MIMIFFNNNVRVIILFDRLTKWFENFVALLCVLMIDWGHTNSCSIEA